METAYKEILLFNGFEQLDEDELKKFKFLIPEKLQIPKSQLKAAKRTDVAQLMVESVGAETALKEAIKLFKKLKQNETAKNLEKEKKKGNVGVVQLSWPQRNKTHCTWLEFACLLGPLPSFLIPYGRLRHNLGTLQY